MQKSKIYIVVSLCGKYAKIGYAVNIRRRLRDIQTSCPFPLAIYREFSTPAAPHIEAELHRAFRDYRIRGEWFKGDKVIESLANVATDQQLLDFLMS
jgi:hypothetical protein